MTNLLVIVFFLLEGLEVLPDVILLLLLPHLLQLAVHAGEDHGRLYNIIMIIILLTDLSPLKADDAPCFL